MAKVIYSKEIEIINQVQPLYDKQRNKHWKFNFENFEIDETDFSFKYNTWKTWCIGGNNLEETYKIIRKYIEETSKPYMQGDLSFIHLKPE